MRQVTAQDYASPARDLFADSADLRWLRKLRNELMHAGAPGTRSRLWKVGGNDIAANHGALEDEATRAVEIMFRAIYHPPQRRGGD